MQNEIEISEILHRILTEVLVFAEINSQSISEAKRDKVDAALNLIRDNYFSDLDVSSMAKSVCMSPYHFSRSFKKATGYSPYNYLLDYRIGIAKALLCNSSYSIDEIADKSGFGSTNNFIVQFRKNCGVTPTKYRAQM